MGDYKPASWQAGWTAVEFGFPRTLKGFRFSREVLAFMGLIEQPLLPDTVDNFIAYCQHFLIVPVDARLEMWSEEFQMDGIVTRWFHPSYPVIEPQYLIPIENVTFESIEARRM